uniref:Uncharacterized protein n=1 Tax=Chenopodium quinoa TaxID=63459 RepID=A0A803MDT2_CHEQI
MVCGVLVNGEPKVPCYFIFGDSLSDVGNNNHLVTLAKANFSPYGVDFPGGVSTGRFTNNRTVDDYISTFLGFNKSITPYRDQMDQDILRGVNFASGSAGILIETGFELGDSVWLDRQILNYIKTILRLQFMVRGPVSNYLNKCLYTVNIGSNDYLNNYFLPLLYPSKRLFTPDEYANRLIARYRLQLRNGSSFRHRSTRLRAGPNDYEQYNSCVDEVNEAAKIFNTKLESLVDDFNARLPGAKFTLINFSAFQAVNPLPADINTSSPCCTLNIVFECEPHSTPCANRDLYAYFDGVHPSDVFNGMVAEAAYNTSDRRIARPMNINQLTNNQKGKSTY